MVPRFPHFGSASVLVVIATFCDSAVKKKRKEKYGIFQSELMIDGLDSTEGLPCKIE